VRQPRSLLCQGSSPQRRSDELDALPDSTQTPNVAAGEPRNARIKIALRDTDRDQGRRERAPVHLDDTRQGPELQTQLDKDVIKGIENYGIDYQCAFHPAQMSGRAAFPD